MTDGGEFPFANGRRGNYAMQPSVIGMNSEIYGCYYMDSLGRIAVVCT